MAIQITIVGLGQIGGSIGLALAGQSKLLTRVGHDRELGIARRAEKMGALDKVSMNLPNAVREADLVLLSLPLNQIREALQVIGADLKEDAVVMDTGPVKQAVAAWAAELLPPRRHYVGLTPVLNPEYLHNIDAGLDAAHADLFRKGLIAIATPPGTTSDAVKLAADLTRLLGANPLFVDPMEIDSLMAATHILPQLLGAALLNITVGQPGWREGRKVAGRAYAEVTGPIAILSDAEALRSEATLNRQNVVRLLDSLAAALHALRNDIQQDDPALEERLERARKGRAEWWSQRQAADWSVEESNPVPAPSTSEFFGRLLGMGRRPKTPGG